MRTVCLIAASLLLSTPKASVVGRWQGVQNAVETVVLNADGTATMIVPGARQDVVGNYVHKDKALTFVFVDPHWGSKKRQMKVALLTDEELVLQNETSEHSVFRRVDKKAVPANDVKAFKKLIVGRFQDSTGVTMEFGADQRMSVTFKCGAKHQGTYQVFNDKLIFDVSVDGKFKKERWTILGPLDRELRAVSHDNQYLVHKRVE